MLRALAGECADARHPEQLRRKDSRGSASFSFVNKKRTRFFAKTGRSTTDP